ncbi:MAG TPA: LytR C-terminal domain-containing protein [Acidimicrobiia bacterium]|jgi:hypothetical protein|nr:LytR C-terminal domain-containing protein [Acidimicrobiia bacterium]
MADRGARPGGFSGGPSLPDGLKSQTAKGAMLIALAVIVGIVLLQIVDPGKTGPVGARTTISSTSTTTSTTTPKRSTTSTTKASTPQKTAAQVRLLVLNAGAPTGSAGNVSTNLKNSGYTNQGTPTDNASKITGEKVLCLPNLTREQAKIVQLLGPSTLSGPLTADAATGAAGYDCVVLVGSG